MHLLRNVLLSAAVLLAGGVPASPCRARVPMSTAEYRPPAQAGDIYTVIDFTRSGGEAQVTTIDESMAGRHRDLTVVPHDYCAATTPTGVVVRFRHYPGETGVLTVSTSGTFVHRPEQGTLPVEATHRCYQLVS